MEQRLIDAIHLVEIIKEHDYELSNKHNSIDRGMFTVGIQQAIDELPAIDPVHAAGGCYCRECDKFARNLVGCVDYGVCMRTIKLAIDTGFCSYGEREQNEILD